MGNGESFPAQTQDAEDSGSYGSPEENASLDVARITSKQIIAALGQWFDQGGETLRKENELESRIFRYYMKQAHDYFAFYVQGLSRKGALGTSIYLAGYPEFLTIRAIVAVAARYNDFTDENRLTYFRGWYRNWSSIYQFVEGRWEDPLGIKPRLKAVTESNDWVELPKDSKSYATLFYLARTNGNDKQPSESTVALTSEDPFSRVDYAIQKLPETTTEFGNFIAEIEKEWKEKGGVDRFAIVQLFTFTSQCFCLQYPTRSLSKESAYNMVGGGSLSDDDITIFGAMPYVRKEGEFAFQDWVVAIGKGFDIVSFPMAFVIKTDAVLSCAYYFALHDYDHLRGYLSKFPPPERRVLSEVARKITEKIAEESISDETAFALCAPFFFGVHEFKDGIDDKILLSNVALRLLQITNKYKRVLQREFEEREHKEFKLTYICFFVLCDWIDDYRFLDILIAHKIVATDPESLQLLQRLRRLEIGEYLLDQQNNLQYFVGQSGNVIVQDVVAREEEGGEQKRKEQRSKARLGARNK